MEQIWKVIKDFPNYSISNDGVIKNKSNHILSPANVGGYLQVRLYEKKIPKSLKIHRLVAQEFIDNIENLSIVDHIDRNKLNNHVDNLRWVNNSENSLNINKTPYDIKKLVSARPVLKINIKTNKIINEYNSITLAATELFDKGLTNSISSGKTNIWGVLNNKIQIIQNGDTTREKKVLSAYGYKWKYADNISKHAQGIETWKDIPSVFIKNINKYQISNYGRIKNNRGRIGEGSSKHHSGYNVVTIKYGTFLMHRLVAQVFIDNPKSLPIVNHIDGDKLNNHVDNLEWVSSSENAQHKCDNGLGVNKKVYQYDLNMVLIKEFNSIKEAARILTIRSTSIGNCCSGKQKTAGGFKFSN
jgi:hypothetical protein